MSKGQDDDDGKSRKTTTRMDDDKDYCSDEIMTYAVLVILEF